MASVELCLAFALSPYNYHPIEVDHYIWFCYNDYRYKRRLRANLDSVKALLASEPLLLRSSVSEPRLKRNLGCRLYV